MSNTITQLGQVTGGTLAIIDSGSIIERFDDKDQWVLVNGDIQHPITKAMVVQYMKELGIDTIKTGSSFKNFGTAIEKWQTVRHHQSPSPEKIDTSLELLTQSGIVPNKGEVVATYKHDYDMVMMTAEEALGNEKINEMRDQLSLAEHCAPLAGTQHQFVTLKKQMENKALPIQYRQALEALKTNLEMGTPLHQFVVTRIRKFAKEANVSNTTLSNDVRLILTDATATAGKYIQAIRNQPDFELALGFISNVKLIATLIESPRKDQKVTDPSLIVQGLYESAYYTYLEKSVRERLRVNANDPYFAKQCARTVQDLLEGAPEDLVDRVPSDISRIADEI